MYGFRFWAPMVNPFPLHSMLTRLKTKLSRIRFRILRFYVLPYLRVSGAKDLGKNSDGNQTLSLNSENFLGKKNTLIQIPKDFGLYAHVRVSGAWQTNECRAIAGALDRIAANSEMVPTLIDIGANVGLISLQVANMVKFSIKIHAVEPLPRHFNCILANLEKAPNIHSTKIWPVAISEEDGFSNIYSEKNHYGNTSLDKNSMGKHKFKTECIENIDALKIFSEINKDLTKFVIKIDTQGQDLLILSSIPREMLEKTDFILVEVWSQKGISKNQVERIDEICSIFSNIYIFGEPHIKLNAKDVKNLWLSENNNTVDLVLSRHHGKAFGT